ncbi:MAG: ATP-dependent Clp protease ATP-binding subunit [Patescibacteria group bacterium]
MESIPNTTPGFSFSDPRLVFGTGNRFLVRSVSSVTYAILAAAALVCSLSDLRELRSAGMLTALFLIDRVVHAWKPERPLRFFHGNSGNVASYFTPESLNLLFTAFHRAKSRGAHFTLILLSLVSERSEIRSALQRIDAPPDDFQKKIKEAIETAAPHADMDEAHKVAVAAFEEALARDAAAVEPAHLFTALARLKEPDLIRVFGAFEINDDDLGYAISLSSMAMKRPRKTLTAFFGEPRRLRHRVMNRAWSSRPTPVLDSVSEDLTDKARAQEIGFLIGHDREYRALLDVLARPQKENVVLVGEVGSGKGAIAGRLARDMVRDRVPSTLFDHRLVELSLGNLVASAHQAEIEDRVRRIVDEIETAGNVTLYIPDIHNLVRTAGGHEMSAADVLLPALRRESFSVIGSCPPREFREYLEPVSDILGTFEVIRVTEITPPEATGLLAHESVVLERKHHTTVSFKAIRKAVELGRRYLAPKPLPGSARELLGEAFAYAERGGRKVVTPADVIAVTERRVSVPIHEAEGKEAAKLLDLERFIHERFIDQEEAVRAVARAVREYRSGLTRRGGPIASFLFVGPTGVGKTELAKILTTIQFGDERFMVRFDMSEFQSKESFIRFIGSPDGSVRGSLTDAILEKPYCVILLDEFEKAHPDILNLFLQVTDDGRLTDGLGRTVDFSNTIIIATSNAHSDFVKSEIERGTSISEIAEQLKRKLTVFFRPELLNRLSATIVFKSLQPADVLHIARLELVKLGALLRENHGIELSFDDAAVTLTAELGYDPAFGARPLRGVISDKMRAVLAEKLLKHEIQRGNTVKVGVAERAFTFNLIEINK